MLGVKVKNVKFKNEYSIQELYEKIKNEKFSAGTPSITKHGNSGFGEPYNKIKYKQRAQSARKYKTDDF